MGLLTTDTKWIIANKAAGVDPTATNRHIHSPPPSLSVAYLTISPFRLHILLSPHHTCVNLTDGNRVSSHSLQDPGPTPLGSEIYTQLSV